jgi:hypothetical protein
MAKSTVNRRTANNSRYRRDQRIATTGTLVLLIITAAISWLLYYRPDPAETAAPSPPTASPPPMHVWLAESEPSISDLVTARNNIATAAAQRDLTRTGSACRAAAGKVANLHVRMPSPEPTLTSSLQQAIHGYEIGLPYCISATQTRDGEGMQRAAAYITRGDGAMRAALEFLRPASEPRQLAVLIV